MSDKLPSLNSRQLIRVLERKGWRVHRIRGSHYIMVHEALAFPVTVPLHNRDLKIGTLNSILRDACISREELRDLL